MYNQTMNNAHEVIHPLQLDSAALGKLKADFEAQGKSVVMVDAFSFQEPRPTLVGAKVEFLVGPPLEDAHVVIFDTQGYPRSAGAIHWRTVSEHIERFAGTYRNLEQVIII